MSSCISAVTIVAYFRTAASDTTATALTFATYHLLAKRAYWDRLCHEIRTKFKSIDEITHVAVANIPFLDAVVHEGISYYGYQTDFSTPYAAPCPIKSSTRSSPRRSNH